MADIFLSIPSVQLLALTAYGEAATEGAEGMMAVLNVIKNRTKDPKTFADQNILASTGSIWHAVVLKPYQFSVFNFGNPMRSKLEALARSFNTAIANNETLRKAYELAKLTINGLIADNTGGATYYHATYVRPSWSMIYQRLTQIGRHIFYTPRVVLASVSSPTAIASLAIVLTGLILTRKEV